MGAGAWATAGTAGMITAYTAAGIMADIGIQGVEMAAGMQNGFNVSELTVAAITAGFDGYLNASAINAVRAAEASGKTLEAASMVEKMTHVAESVVLRQLSELALGQRSKFDFTAAGIDIAVAYANQTVSDKLDADTYAANPNATSGDLVANHMTAAAVSTAMAVVLGSAVKHQPLNVANTAANAIGAAVGTGIGSTFADQLDAHYQQAEKGVQYTKQARRHAASMRAPTAAEQHAPGARPVAKPKPAARAYNPYNDPEILKAEAVANMSLPGAGIDLNPDAVGKQQAIYNASAVQHQNWQVDHSVMGGLDRSWHYIKNRVKSYAHFYDNYIVPSMQGLAAAANGPFPYSTSMSLAMNVGLPLATNVMNWPSTMAANYRNFVNMDANDKTYTIITGAYNNLEQVAIGLGSESLGAVSKIGMFAVAAKAATAAKVVGAGKILGASKLAFGGMFGRTVEVGGEKLLNPEQQMLKALHQLKVYEQLENIHASSLNALDAISNKYSRLERVQTTADKIQNLPDGSIRYYDKFRSAKTSGPTTGSRFVTEYEPSTGNMKMWNETYDLSGAVNRIHLKNINGISINSPHFPPTLRDILDREFSNLPELK